MVTYVYAYSRRREQSAPEDFVSTRVNVVVSWSGSGDVISRRIACETELSKNRLRGFGSLHGR